jgi:hypothetical protein
LPKKRWKITAKAVAASYEAFGKPGILGGVFRVARNCPWTR